MNLKNSIYKNFPFLIEYKETYYEIKIELMPSVSEYEYEIYGNRKSSHESNKSGLLKYNEPIQSINHLLQKNKTSHDSIYIHGSFYENVEENSVNNIPRYIYVQVKDIYHIFFSINIKEDKKRCKYYSFIEMNNIRKYSQNITVDIVKKEESKENMDYELYKSMFSYSNESENIEMLYESSNESSDSSDSSEDGSEIIEKYYDFDKLEESTI